jgi:hypothetical protein
MSVNMKLPRKLKKECKKTTMLWVVDKSNYIRIRNYNKQKRTFEEVSNCYGYFIEKVIR